MRTTLNAQIRKFTNAFPVYWANMQIKMRKFTNALSNYFTNICSEFSAEFFVKCPLFNRRCVYFLAFKRLVNKNFNNSIFIFKEIM